MSLKRFAIFCHRWTGTAFCILFTWWFVSGIFMMYVDFPEVNDSDRIRHARPIDPARLQLTPAEAWAKLNTPGEPDDTKLLTYEARPAYSFRLGSGRNVVFADNGQTLTSFPADVNLRTAAAWSGEAAAAAHILELTAPDQWTVGGIFRQYKNLIKYSWPDGQQVYIAPATGEVVQYTTTRSRILAYCGPVAHWLYFTPLRKNAEVWSRIVIWLSGAATAVALLGLFAGLSLYSPSKKIAFTGTKRLHMILGLFFGFLACTWSFSGMLSMDPFPVESHLDSRFPAAIVNVPTSMEDYASKAPREALRGIIAKEVEFIRVAGRPVYMALGDAGRLLAVPASGEFGVNDVLVTGSLPTGYSGRIMNQYDAYYLDRTKKLPLPVFVTQLNDAVHSRFYVDPWTNEIVGSYSSDQWPERWLYHGLHSMNFPWLYNHRPAWDIVVLVLMLGGTALSITSMIIGWSFLRRKVYSIAGDK